MNSIAERDITVPTRGRLLYVFPHPARRHQLAIEAGESPSEILYGAIELRRRGWQLDYADARFVGFSARFYRKLRTLGINMIDLRSIAELGRYDCIMIKDVFSTFATIAAKATRIPILYQDALFDLPIKVRHRALARVNLALADRVLCYSRSQVQLWAQEFAVPEERLPCVPFCIDTDFYLSGRRETTVERMVLSVGSDLGRDFPTLVMALQGADVKLVLVTRPHLVTEETRRQPNVEIHGWVSYETLFDLYARAACVVVPIKGGMTYPSGIRAAMEALVLGKATVATESPVLREYFPDSSGICFVTAGDDAALRAEIMAILDDSEWRQILERQGPRAMETYDIEMMVDRLEQVLTEVTR